MPAIHHITLNSLMPTLPNTWTTSPYLMRAIFHVAIKNELRHFKSSSLMSEAFYALNSDIWLRLIMWRVWGLSFPLSVLKWVTDTSDINFLEHWTLSAPRRSSVLSLLSLQLFLSPTEAFRQHPCVKLTWKAVKNPSPAVHEATFFRFFVDSPITFYQVERQLSFTKHTEHTKTHKEGGTPSLKDLG